MHNFIWLIATALLALGLPVASLAQDDKDKKLGVAYSRYDKARNQTTIEVERLEVGGTADQFYVVNAFVVVPGEKLVRRPEDVGFVIQIGSLKYTYGDQLSVKLRVDGVAQPDLKMVTLDRRSSDKWFIETIGARIPYDVFKAIATAKEVEFTVDKTKISIGASHLGILGNMDKMLNP